MFHPNRLTPKELVFLAELIDQGSDSIARQVCEDMSDLAFDLFDPKEKDHLEHAFHDWNGDPQDFIPGYFMPNAPGWLAYHAAQFRRLAEEGGLQSAQGRIAMTYTYICPSCLARQDAPAGGKLVSQEIGGRVGRCGVFFAHAAQARWPAPPRAAPAIVLAQLTPRGAAEPPQAAA